MDYYDEGYLRIFDEKLEGIYNFASETVKYYLSKRLS